MAKRIVYKQNTASSTLLLGIIIVFSTIISFLKETVFANYFGTTPEADAYSLAFQIPTIIFSIVSVAAGTVIIPIYTDAQKKDCKLRADHFFSTIVTLVVIFSLIIALVLIIFSDFVISIFAPGLSESTKPIASLILKITAGMIIFSSISESNTGVLNVFQIFSIPKLITNIRNISGILFLLFLYNQWGVYAMAAGTMIGIVAESLISSLITRKFVNYRPSLDLKDPYFKDSLKMVLPVAIGVSITELSAIINKVIASYLPEGSLSSINYSTRLISVLSTLTVSTIETTMFPILSKHASENDNQKLSDSFSSLIIYEFMLSLPIAIGGMILSTGLIALTFQRGAFSETDTLLVGGAFFWYLPGFLMQSLRSAISKLFYAKKNTKIPISVNVVELLLTIGLNCLFTFVLNYGINGIAISSSISSFCAFMLMVVLFKKKCPEISLKGVEKDFLKVTVSALLMGVVIFVLNHYLDNLIDTKLLTIILILGGALLYLALLAIFKTAKFFSAFSLIKGTFSLNKKKNNEN